MRLELEFAIQLIHHFYHLEISAVLLLILYVLLRIVHDTLSNVKPNLF